MFGILILVQSAVSVHANWDDLQDSVREACINADRTFAVDIPLNGVCDGSSSQETNLTITLDGLEQYLWVESPDRIVDIEYQADTLFISKDFFTNDMDGIPYDENGNPIFETELALSIESFYIE